MHDLGVLAAEFEHQVEILARVAEIAGQAFDRRVEADEHHPAVAFEARYRLEAECLTVEGRRVGVVARDRGQMPAEVEGPGVIKAAEEPGRAGTLAADDVAAMRAGVEERARGAICVAHQDDRTPADPSGDKVARIGDFRFMAGIEPRVVEYLAPFLLQDLRIGEHAPVDAKDAPRAIVEDQVLHFCPIHSAFLRLPTPPALFSA